MSVQVLMTAPEAGLREGRPAASSSSRLHRRLSRYSRVSAKTVFQSFLMLTTVQPRSVAVSSDFSAPAV
jgi:hypothetical protein